MTINILDPYIAFINGEITDTEFFKLKYAGPDGEVYKAFTADSRSYPFFVIKRPDTDYYGRDFWEMKLYDLKHNGPILKEKLFKNVSPEQWWEKKAKRNCDFTNYLGFLRDSGALLAADVKSRKKKK